MLYRNTSECPPPRVTLRAVARCRRQINGLAYAMVALLLAACGGSKYGAYVPAYTPPAEAESRPNYNQLYYWAAHPLKHSPADSVPKPYRNTQRDTSVDVFFVHPTIYLSGKAVDSNRLATDSTEQLRWNANVNDAELNATVDYSTMLQQASAFNHFSVYAPRYRQAHIQAFALDAVRKKPFFDTAYADVRAAFVYYLKHYNRGRRFVIASHSQGTLHAGRLMQEFIDGKPLQQQLVAAYLIGLPVPSGYFSSCAPCSTAAQNQCFVSWRTYKKGYTPAYVVAEPFKAVVVNPLSWTLDSVLAPKAASKGAVLYNFNKPLPASVSTQIVGNVLWSSKPRFFGSIFFTRKNYHIGDINLFWVDVRENLRTRVAAKQ
ncbi:MAG: DUF3089 domain-containing protein [Bacteroidetes bacterium]|nr:MAG: DUF3089 domain-containing protein [Bacteroidota bacterium]